MRFFNIFVGYEFEGNSHFFFCILAIIPVLQWSSGAAMLLGVYRVCKHKNNIPSLLSTIESSAWFLLKSYPGVIKPNFRVSVQSAFILLNPNQLYSLNLTAQGPNCPWLLA